MENVAISILSNNEFDEFYDYFTSSLYKDFPDIKKDVMDFYVEKGYRKDVLSELVINKKRTVFLAKIEGRIIGYLLTLQDWGGVNIALWFAVEEEFRGKGIGRSLLDYWEKNSKISNNHALLLYTTTDENRSFYKHMGFSEAGILPNFWFNIDHYVFFKNI